MTTPVSRMCPLVRRFVVLFVAAVAVLFCCSAYAADGLCPDGLSRLCNAERAHVLLLNMLALGERDVRLLTGSGTEGKR